ncbi:MAG: PIN domain-containing protein, partial [Actinomycetes bacterium]
MQALIDSSVLIAAARITETNHAAARAAMEHYAPGGLGVPVTILAETVSFLRARLGIDQQRRFWDAFAVSGIELVAVDAELLERARAIDLAYADAGFGFADCTLLATCEQERVATVLSLDRRLGAYRPSFAPALLLAPQ